MCAEVWAQIKDEDWSLVGNGIRITWPHRLWDFTSAGYFSRANPVGTRLRIMPNHSCLTAAMYDAYHVVDGDRIVAEWRPVRGW